MNTPYRIEARLLVEEGRKTGYTSHGPISSSPPPRFTTDIPLSLVIAPTTTRRMCRFLNSWEDGS